MAPIHASCRNLVYNHIFLKNHCLAIKRNIHAPNYVGNVYARSNIITSFKYPLTFSQLKNCRNYSDDSSKNDKDGDINKENLPVDNDESTENAKKTLVKNRMTELLNSMQIDIKQDANVESITPKLAKPNGKNLRAPSINIPVPKMDDVSAKIEDRLIAAAKIVGSSIGGTKGERTESDLLKMLRSHSVEISKNKTEGLPELSKIVTGMGVQKSQSQAHPRKDSKLINKNLNYNPNFVSTYKKRDRYIPDAEKEGPSQLNSSEKLNIFKQNIKENPDAPILETWNRLYRHELDCLVAQPPNNQFEEMIRWTEQGKLWSYPIDNDVGLDEEANVPFYEHVLLDHLLEDFPARGPIRDFMELVILGLGSNPYMNVARKHAYVRWYHEYFKEKEELLEACEAI